MKKIVFLFSFLCVLCFAGKAMAWQVGVPQCIKLQNGSQQCETLLGITQSAPQAVQDIGPLPNQPAGQTIEQCVVKFSGNYQLTQWAFPGSNCSIFYSEPLGSWSIDSGPSFIAPVVPTNP